MRGEGDDHNYGGSDGNGESCMYCTGICPARQPVVVMVLLVAVRVKVAPGDTHDQALMLLFFPPTHPQKAGGGRGHSHLQHHVAGVIILR